MTEPLHIDIAFDSGLEQVLGFKTCCGLKLEDQNLEIRVRNDGNLALRIMSRLELELDDGRRLQVANLYPQPSQVVEPHGQVLFTCYLDEQLWPRCRRAWLDDDLGRRYEVGLTHNG